MPDVDEPTYSEAMHGLDAGRKAAWRRYYELRDATDQTRHIVVTNLALARMLLESAHLRLIDPDVPVESALPMYELAMQLVSAALLEILDGSADAYNEVVDSMADYLRSGRWKEL